MNPAIYRFTLDINDAASQVTLSLKRGERGRRFLITLTEGGVPYAISEGGYAVFSARRESDGAVLTDGGCTVCGDVIAYDTGAALCAAVGHFICDITLFGINGEALVSASFGIVVYSSALGNDEVEGTDEFRTLSELVTVAEGMNSELEDLRDEIAAELEKANDTIDDFDAWHDATADELAEFVSGTETVCEKLLSDTEAEVESLKKEVSTAMAEFTSLGAFATVPADAWSDDTDLLSGRARAQRIAYKSKEGACTDIMTHDWNSATDAILTEDWQTFEVSFVYTPADYSGSLYLMFYGGKSDAFCHPYDIADVKLWVASDTERTNLFPEDIAELNWWWHYDTGTCPEVNRFSVAYEDGHKYIHVWRQKEFATAGGVLKANLAYLRAGTGFKATVGETYVLSVRMRTTCGRHTCIVPLDGIRAHSSTVVTPVPGSAVACVAAGVRAFGERIGELMFVCDSVPSKDLTLSVAATCGEGGAILNCAPAYSVSSEAGGVSGTYSGDYSGILSVKIIENTPPGGVMYRSELVSDNPRVIDIGGTFGTLEIVNNGKLYTLSAGESVCGYLYAAGSSTNTYSEFDAWAGPWPVITFTGSEIHVYTALELYYIYPSGFADEYHYNNLPYASQSTSSSRVQMFNAYGVVYSWRAY